MTKPLEYYFGDCHLNAATRDLSLHGELQRIEPRVLDFLIYLIERRDRVVRKDELIAHVWDGEILTDSVLARAASKARKAIGDAVDDSALVRTVHRVGYRFVGEIRIVESTWGTLPPPDSPSASTAAGLIPSSEFRPSVALTLGLSVHESGPLAANRGTAESFVLGTLDFFAPNDDVTSWTQALPALSGAQRLNMLLRLAWHLRQRDTSRALSLADEAHAMLGGCRNKEAMRARARLMLVRGESKWLLGQLHMALDLGQEAAATFEACADPVGECDAALLQAAICTDRDDPVGRSACLNAVLEKAKKLDDNERYPLLQLQLALAETLLNPESAETKWSPRIEQWLTSCGPGVRAVCHYVQANLALGRGDRGQRLQSALAARDLYSIVGQRREVIRETGNVGALFANLFDNEAALKWMTRALTEARSAGWPLTLGACLAQTAAAIGIMLKRPADAVGLLDEARELLRAFPGNRVATMALSYHGDVQLALGEHATALAAFEQVIVFARARRSTEEEVDALIGRARSLSCLGRSHEARDAALEALNIAETGNNDYRQFLVLQALAEIHRDHRHLQLDGTAESSVVLHYLLRALDKQSTDNPRTVPAALLAGLATEYARLCDYVNAYAYQVRSQAAYAEAQSTEVNSRAVAMKIHHEAEQARADSEHHRALAVAHAERAEALAQTNATLARITMIGQEITQHLDARAVFAALEQHVHGMLDASLLAVFLLDSSGRTLELAFGMEASAPLSSIRVALNDPRANVARCARERREIYVDSVNSETAYIATALPSRSALFVPLNIGSRVLGVLTVQSPQTGAYGERERLVLRSLSGYSAVALDNAIAYHRLESARDALALTHAELLEKDHELERTRSALERINAEKPTLSS